MATQTFGKYEVLEKVGEGGFGEVYKARDPFLDRIVALKIVKAALLAEDPLLVERFHREARAAARLKHPHIVTVYEAQQVQGIWYMAMEYLPGGSLADRLRERGPLPLEEVVRVLGEVASALDHAHSQGVVHRDIKPSNILFDRDGRAVVTDFGLARAASEHSGLTTAGVLLGTIEYMAPEQLSVKRRGEVGPATDVYGLGVVVYEMLTGRVPFRGSTEEVIGSHFMDEPEPPRRVRGEVSEEAEGAVLRALAKRPGERFQSAGAFAEAFAAGVGVAGAVGLRAREPEVERVLGPGVSGQGEPVKEGPGLEAKGRAGREAEDRARQEAARREAEEQAKQEAEERARQEAARREAEEQARQEAARREAEEQAAQEEAEERAQREEEKPGEVRAEPRRRPGWVWAVLAGLLVMGVAIIGPSLRAPTPTPAPMQPPSHENAALVVVPWGKDPIRGIAYSPDGRLLAVASSPGVYLYDAATLDQVRFLETDAPVYSVAFSPDGKILASGSEDRTVRLWRVADGEVLRTLEGHTYRVWSVAFSPDGEVLASGSWDRTVRLWRVADGEVLRTLEGHTGYVRSVAFSPEDRKSVVEGQSV